MLIDIHTEDVRGNVFTLLEPVTFEQPGVGIFTVPVGFESDGASVPRLFWRLIFPPTDSLAIRAGVAHDYLYRTPLPGVTRQEADYGFRVQLIADGVPAWRAILAWLGVRIGGWVAWRENRRNGK